MTFEGKRVWVTGASSGIGEALVGPLLRRGARVAITARRRDRLEAAAAPHPRNVLVAAADVTDRTAVTAAARDIERAWGGIDVAIFNAGGAVAETRGPFDGDAYVQTMALNYFSVVYGLDAVLGGMLARGNGHVAAVASLAGYRAGPVANQYGASKAAVIHLMHGIRFELAPRGIAVTVINPGFVRTPLTARQTFPMPFLIEAADAAERIVRGLEREKKEIHFPAPLSWPMKVMRTLPAPIYDRIVGMVAPKK